MLDNRFSNIYRIQRLSGKLRLTNTYVTICLRTNTGSSRQLYKPVSRVSTRSSFDLCCAAVPTPQKLWLTHKYGAILRSFLNHALDGFRDHDIHCTVHVPG